uniref:Ig-like domain-containing protein n=1 Tax=Angiostrongylus cantonensis TaxID=6313 RepID=A0A0K0DBA1_ANGCA
MKTLSAIYGVKKAGDEYEYNEYGPRIVRHSFFKQHFRLGYKLKLFCEAHGTPSPDMRWYKDGVEIRLRPGIRIRAEITANSVASHMEIDPAGVLDAGEYECVANNAHGYHLQHICAEARL